MTSRQWKSYLAKKAQENKATTVKVAYKAPEPMKPRVLKVEETSEEEETSETE